MYRYVPIAAELRDAILSGRYAPGLALSSEKRLAEHYGVTVGVIRRARVGGLYRQVRSARHTANIAAQRVVLRMGD
jgi:DNA-binding transcriptional MocR family regulator